LSKLYEVTETTYQKIRVLLALVPARLDYSQALPSIPHESWVEGLKELDLLLSILIREPGYVVQETVGEYDDMVEREPEEVDGKTVKVEIAGNIISLVENIDNEVSNSLGLADIVHKNTSTYRCAR
jgi:translation initiation factor 3 subunit C